jgi:hypothetical protein
MRHLYEIPIPQSPLASRRLMRSVAGNPRSHPAGNISRFCRQELPSQVGLLHGKRPRVGGNIQMFDLIMLAIGLGFFALAIRYAYACDRL